MTTATAPKTQERKTAAARQMTVKDAVLSSMFVWFVVLFIACDQATRMTHPPGKKSGFSDKLTSFFRSDRHPDILLIGSSVALSSSFESDSAIGLLTEKHNKANYHGAVQLQRSIQSTTGKNLTAENLACYASTANYAWLLSEKLVEFRKTPKVLIYEICSRDLFDASVPRSFQSEYYQTLVSLHPQQSGRTDLLRVALDCVLHSHVVTLLQNLISDPNTFKNPDRVRFEFDSAVGSLVHIYEQRVELQFKLADAASLFFGKSASLQSSASKNEIENKKKNPFGEITSQPVGAIGVDSSPQLGRFEDEKCYFLKLLSVCRENNIRLIVVNMPMTEQYESLVPIELRPRWPKDVREATEKSGFEFIDLNDKKTFARSDFIDFGHLNRSGALKTNALLVKEISRRDVLKGL